MQNSHGGPALLAWGRRLANLLRWLRRDAVGECRGRRLRGSENRGQGVELDGLVVKQRFRQTLKPRPRFAQEPAHARLPVGQQRFDGGVDAGRRRLAVVAALRQLVAEKRLLFVGCERRQSPGRSSPSASPSAAPARVACDEVALGAGRDFAEDDFFGAAAAEHHRDARQQVRRGSDCAVRSRGSCSVTPSA